jgi:hypothetical protein
VRVESVGEAERRLEEIVRLLRGAPPLSGREIARRVGCSHGYVDKVRHELPDRAGPEVPTEPRWRTPGRSVALTPPNGSEMSCSSKCRCLPLSATSCAHAWE